MDTSKQEAEGPQRNIEERKDKNITAIELRRLKTYRQALTELEILKAKAWRYHFLRLS